MNATPVSDAQLGHELMSGSLEAFEHFVDLYYTKIFQYSFTMCGHREDAEEVAQETLLKVFEKLALLREPEHLKAWVFQIAKNTCLMKRRKSIFAPRTELSLDDLKIEDRADGASVKMEIADWSALPENLLQDAELRNVLDRTIRELPELFKAVVLLRDVEGLTTNQAAAILEVSEDVVKTRLHRAHLALRKTLGEHLRTTRGVLRP